MFSTIRFISISFLLISVWVSTGNAQIRYVSTTGIDVLGCGTLGNPCQTLQFTLDNVVNDGDEVYLFSGTYSLANTVANTTPLAILPLGYSLTFRGDSNGTGTVLDGMNQRQLFRYDYLSNCPTASAGTIVPDTVDLQFINLDIINGYQREQTCGSTTQARGGAIEVFNNPGSELNLTLEDCLFLNNRTTDSTGANNNGRSASGGAIYFHGLLSSSNPSTGATAVIRRCDFNGNYAVQAANGGHGGAIYLLTLDQATIEKSSFCGNYVFGINSDNGDLGRDRNAGGAICIVDNVNQFQAHTYTIDSCSFVGNSALTTGGAGFVNKSEGGAVFLSKGDNPSSNTNANLTITNSLAFNNIVETGIEHFDVNSGNLLVSGGLQNNAFNLQVLDLGPDSSFCSAGFWKTVPVFLGASYLWSTGSDSNAAFITGPGNYWVEISWVGGCAISDTVIYTPGVGNLGTRNDTSICNGQSLVLNAPLNMSNPVWSTGLMGPNFTVTLSGTYWVQGVDTSGCTLIDTTVVSISNSITVFNDTTLCASESWNMLAPVGASNYMWNDGSANANLIANQSGKYWVQSQLLSGCQRTDTFQLNWHPAINLNLGPDVVVCGVGTSNFQASGFISYLWSDGSTGQGYSTIQTEIISLTVTDTNGCVDSDTVGISYGAGGVNLGPDGFGCVGFAPPTISVDPNWATVLWSDASTLDSITVAPPFQLWVQVTDSLNCSYSDTLNWGIASPPVLDLGPDASYCAGGSHSLSVPIQPGWTLDWTSGGNDNPLVVNSTQTVIGSMTNNCGSVFDSVTITIYDPLFPNLGPDTSFCPDSGDLVLQSSSLNGSFIWNTGEIASAITLTGPGNYSVTVTDVNGCVGRDSISVGENCPLSIYIPNAFTPNNDTHNDYFRPVGRGLRDYHFLIYNRWGQLLFETRNPEEGWNGKFKGKEVAVDAYVWVVTFRGDTNATQVRRGHVTLIR